MELVRVPTKLTTASFEMMPRTSQSKEGLSLKFRRSAVTIPFMSYFELYVLVTVSSSLPNISYTVPSSVTAEPVGRGRSISVGKGVSFGSSSGSGVGVTSPVGTGVMSPVGSGPGVTAGVGPSVGVTFSVGVGTSSFSGSTFPDVISIYVPSE